MLSFNHASLLLISFISIISGSKVTGNCTPDACICRVTDGGGCPAWMSSSFSSTSSVTTNDVQVCVGGNGGTIVYVNNDDIVFNDQSYEASALKSCSETEICRTLSKHVRKMVSFFE